MKSIDSNDYKKPFYTENDLIKLCELAKALNYARDQADIKRKALADAITQDEEYRSASSIVQNKQIRLRINKNEVELLKSKINKAQMKFSLLKEQIEKNANETEVIESVEKVKNEADNKFENNNSINYQLISKKNELIFRRRYLLYELYTIYFAETSIDRRQERTCFCNKYDAIRGMHLPIIATKEGHSDDEITAAICHLVNVVNMLCGILNYNFMFPLFFKGSKSFLLEPRTHQIYNLYDPFSRSHRDRYAAALSYFNRGIIQLRSDLGMITRDLERPIQNLQETLLYCIGQINLPPSNRVPKSSIYSIASIVPNLSNLSLNDKNYLQTMIKKRKSRDEDESILDVVSAKNETFDVQKLVSRSIN